MAVQAQLALGVAPPDRERHHRALGLQGEVPVDGGVHLLRARNSGVRKSPEMAVRGGLDQGVVIINA
jgi:hypothetical protein